METIQEMSEEEKLYPLFCSEMKGNFAKIINAHKNKYGCFPEVLTNAITLDLSLLPIFVKHPEFYVKFAKEENEKIKAEDKSIPKIIKEEEIKKPYVLPGRIKKLLESGKLWDNIVIDELEKKHRGDIKAKEIVFLSCLGRLVKNKKAFSFNDLILSTSSAGKDHLISSVLKIFPREDYEIYGRVSAKTLNYLHNLEDEPKYSYDGKIIYLKEITEPILNNEVMKEFTSAEEEISMIAIPRARTKLQGPGVDIIRIRGKPVVFATTATSYPTDETRNRYNIVGLDESREQTRRARINANEEYSEEIKEFLASLKIYEVEIPDKLFKFIDKNFPDDKVRYRRDFPKFLDMIRAVTIFNQHNRRGHTTEVLRAEPEDYNLARDIFMNAFTKLSDVPLKDIPKRIIKILEEKGKSYKTAKEIYEELEGYITLQNLYPYLNDLKAKEIIQEIQDRDMFDKPTTKFYLSEEYKDKKPFQLPIYEDKGI